MADGLLEENWVVDPPIPEIAPLSNKETKNGREKKSNKDKHKRKIEELKRKETKKAKFEVNDKTTPISQATSAEQTQ